MDITLTTMNKQDLTSLYDFMKRHGDIASCDVPVYNHEGDIIDYVKCVFDYYEKANGWAIGYEVICLQYGLYLGQAPEEDDIKDAVRNHFGLSKSVSFACKFEENESL